MSTTIMDFNELSDEALLREMQQLVASERQATARLVACLAEVDRRRLYLALGYTSLFKYGVDVLGLSEDATFARIEVARAARKFPCLVGYLAAGDLTLTAIRLLAPHLTLENHETLLADARHKGMKDVQCVIARHKPQPPVPSTIRKLPQSKPVVSVTGSAASAAPTPVSSRPAPDVSLLPPRGRRTVVAPLSEEAYKIQFTIRREAHDKLRRLQDLLRHQIPNGDPARIFERAMDVLLADVLRTKTGAVRHPRDGKPVNPDSRHVPARVKRAVWKRDGGACAFRAPDGRRCGESGRVEYHHVVPYAAGGKTTVDNLELRCTAHNRYEAEQHFGASTMALFRETAPVYAPAQRPARTTAGKASERELPLTHGCQSLDTSFSRKGRPSVIHFSAGSPCR